MVNVIHYFKSCLEKSHFHHFLDSMYINWLSLWKSVVMKYVLLTLLCCGIYEGRLAVSEVPVPMPMILHVEGMQPGHS